MGRDAVEKLLVERSGGRCEECGMTNAENKRLFRKSLEVHRLYPLGQYALENCVLLCRKCHAKRPKGVNSPWFRRGDTLGIPCTGEQICRLDIVRFFFQSKAGHFIPRDEVIHAAMEYIIDAEGLCRRPEHKGEREYNLAAMPDCK